MKIKLHIGDFVVKEILHDQYLYNIKERNGKFLLFKVMRKNMSHIEMMKKISHFFNIKDWWDIGYGGIKDKRALIEQYITIPRRETDKVIAIDKDLSLYLLGYVSERMESKYIKGNSFTIRVYDYKGDMKPVFYPNYFDEQRFIDKNIEIGKAIIKRDREKLLSYGISWEKLRKERIRAKMFVHSYQSFLWNQLLAGYIKENYPDYFFITDLLVAPKNVRENDLTRELWMPGYGRYREEWKHILDKEGIKLGDFLIKQLPFLSLESLPRKMFVKPLNFSFDRDRSIVSFDLPKGAYATMYLKYIEKNKQENLD